MICSNFRQPFSSLKKNQLQKISLKKNQSQKIEVLLRPGNVVVFSKNAQVQRPRSYEKEIISNC